MNIFRQPGHSSDQSRQRRRRQQTDGSQVLLN